MKILVISDLHLDTKDELGYFRWNEDDFIRRLSDCIDEHKPDRIILNGDVFEYYRYFKKEVKASYSRLLRFLEKHDAVFIRGNHDAVSGRGLDEYQIHDGRNRILILHGHQADFLNGNAFARKLVSAGFKVLRVLTRLKIVRKAYWSIYRKVDRRDPDHRSQSDFRYVLYALKLIEEGWDCVVMGHTHRQEDLVIRDHGKTKIYLNSGTCSNGRFQGVVLDTSTLAYRLISD